MNIKAEVFGVFVIETDIINLHKRRKNEIVYLYVHDFLKYSVLISKHKSSDAGVKESNTVHLWMVLLYFIKF